MFHALVVGYSDSFSFIIYLGASRHMESIKYLITSIYSDSGPTIRMNDDSNIQAKGIGRINLEDEYFNNFQFVTYLAMNLLLLYQMTHISESKRVKFTPDIVEIDGISTNKVVALVFSNHQTRM